MTSTRSSPTRLQVVIAPDGDMAMTVQFGTAIDPRIHDRVLACAHRLETARIPGVIETVPTYGSVTVYYDPLSITQRALTRRLRKLVNALPPGPRPTGRTIDIPVCYDGDFGPDLDPLCASAGLSRHEVVDLHTSVTYRVYMVGFLPGFPYMAPVPQALNTPRLSTPRRSVPAGSVAIAGLQTGIYPMESPGGWRIIGRTPVRIYDPDRAAPFFIQAGDHVRFHSIDHHDYQRLQGT